MARELTVSPQAAAPAAAGGRPPAKGGAGKALDKADAKGKGRANGKAKKERSGSSLGWIQGCLCGAAAALSLATAMTTAILLAPGLLALLIDDRPSKPVARTMLLFGMAGSVAPLVQLWQLGHSVEAAVGVVLHGQTVLTAWMAGGIGWLLTEVAPLIVGMVLSVRMRDNRKKMISTRAELAEEWGLPPPAEPEAEAEEAR
jgi:hypothetical protein